MMQDSADVLQTGNNDIENLRGNNFENARGNNNGGRNFNQVSDHIRFTNIFLCVS